MNQAIDLRQMRYFLAVSEELHFGRAAQRLHMSQPPLSRQIRQLEQQLDVALFDRSKTAVALTPAGRIFLPEARRTLAQAQKAIDAVQALRNADSGTFVVGYTTVFDRSAFPDVLDQLQQQFPSWKHLIKGKHSIRLIRDIKNGEMDVAFIGMHTEAPGLQVETVHEEAVVVAMSSSHPLARKRQLTLNDLRGVPMFFFERRLNPGYYDYCKRFFDRHAYTPDVLPEPADHHVLLGQIAAGHGVALIADSMQAVKRKGVVFRPFKAGTDRLTMGVAMAYAAANQSPLLQPFLELVRRGKPDSA